MIRNNNFACFLDCRPRDLGAIGDGAPPQAHIHLNLEVDNSGSPPTKFGYFVRLVTAVSTCWITYSEHHSRRVRHVVSSGLCSREERVLSRNSYNSDGIGLSALFVRQFIRRGRARRAGRPGGTGARPPGRGTALRVRRVGRHRVAVAVGRGSHVCLSVVSPSVWASHRSYRPVISSL